MQPKEIERNQTGKNIHITGGAEPVEKQAREFTVAEQWDHLAFQLIRQELAPKGFSEIKRGPYRGRVQSNIPFLPKTTVERCQKGAAQLVRAYRDRVRIEVEGQKKNFEWKAGVYADELKKLSVFAFRKRRDTRMKIAECQAKAEILNGMMNKVESISIK